MEIRTYFCGQHYIILMKVTNFASNQPPVEETDNTEEQIHAETTTNVKDS